LDAAAAAAFLGLLWPQIRKNWQLAILGAGIALLSTPYLPAGVPILIAAVAALIPFGSKK
jgi:predicted branched-subunit amino acid permease